MSPPAEPRSAARTTASRPTTTFGGVLGLGFQKNRFGLEGRYDFDFGDAFDEIAAKNNQWAILARIMIK